jgi:hypothetical protein
LAPIDPTELLLTGITHSFPEAEKPLTRIIKTAEKQYLYIKYVTITKLNLSPFCQFCLSCAADGFPEMELVTEQERQVQGQIVMYWYRITCTDVKDLPKHYYKREED